MSGSRLLVLVKAQASSWYTGPTSTNIRERRYGIEEPVDAFTDRRVVVCILSIHGLAEQPSAVR